MALWRAIERRRAGILSPPSASEYLQTQRLRHLELNVDTEIHSPHFGHITWSDVDNTEERYLLTGGSDCTAAVFDLDGQGEVQESADSSSRTASHRHSGPQILSRRRPLRRLEPVGRTNRSSRMNNERFGHSHSISVVRWYPVDTGLFVSGAMDGLVKVWDTNELVAVLDFDLQDKVFAASMSHVTGQQHVIAVGTDNPQAKLCDIRSGAFAHSLTGHSEAIWACAWSPRSDFLLATGSADQTARLWDIRRSGASACLISLDHQRQQDEVEDEGIRQPLGEGSSAWERRAGKGYMQHHKLGPNASRASKYARAHVGPVNSMCFTPDGLHLITSGTDERMRLWVVETGQNTMINYLQTKNRRRRPFGMVVAQPADRKSEMVFFPNDKSGDVLMFPVHSAAGRPTRRLQAHCGPVQCCSYRARTQELVTCGNDGLTLLWSAGESPPKPRTSYVPLMRSASNGEGATSSRQAGRKRPADVVDDDMDMWSGDEHDGLDNDGSREDLGQRQNIGGFVPEILRQHRLTQRGRR